MSTTRTAAVLVGIGVVLSLSGCSSTDTAEANAAYCEGSAAVQAEVDAMAALIESGSSVDLVKAQWNQVQAAIEANSVPLSQLSEAAQDDISTAYDTFTSAVEAIPADLPISEAAPQYDAAIEGLSTDIAAVQDEVGCS